MMRIDRVTAACCAVAIVAACRTTTSGAPPEAVSPPAATTTPAPARQGYTEADVRFMQGMIAHHAQALAMTALVPERTSNPALRLLAERIEVSQKDEIASMQRWLRSRGEMVPTVDPAHLHHGGGEHRMLMPGMLTEEEFARLRNASGTAFERLFLQYMIRHHEGALVMVKQLFSTPGAGQESELYNFASDVEADQQAEIDRMRALLNTIPGGGAPR